MKENRGNTLPDLTHQVSVTARLLDEVVAYAKMFSQEIGHVFTRRTIRITALTGSAAVEIGGQTSASEYKYMSRNDYVREKDIEDHADTRFNIIDEVSFAPYKKAMGKISHYLQKCTQCTEFQYGEAAMVFLGDFCQLEGCEGDLIYKTRNGIYWEQALNCMVELKGTHRYKNCPLMERIMPNMRNHGLSDEDRKILNSRVINGNNVKMPVPNTTRFATYHNKQRCGINIDIFRAYLNQYHYGCTKDNIPNTAIVIKSKCQWAKGRIDLTYEQRKVLFEECSEANIKNSQSKRLDPLLCLCYGSNVMVNANKDVANGIANGTTAEFEKAHLKPGAKLEPMQMVTG